MTHDEERALAQVAREAIAELRARRRWKIFFRFVFLALVLLYVFYLLSALNSSEGKASTGEHVAVVSVYGVISDTDYANALDINDTLERAFSHPHSRAVFLDINSPGGSPVQSAQIYRAIARLKAEHKKPVYALISDVGASGAYYVAAAADKIYADPSSLVGSIGVIFESYGIADLLGKIGVDPRTITSGESKDFLSMTRPLRPEEVAHMQGILANVHEQFRKAVKEGRGERLKDDTHPEIFSGLFWTGEQALELGLVDGLGDMREVAKSEFKLDDLRFYEPALSPWEQVRRSFKSESSAALRQVLGVGQKVQAKLGE